MSDALRLSIHALQDYLVEIEARDLGGKASATPQSWEDKLQAVRTAIAGPTAPGAADALPFIPNYQQCLAKKFLNGTGNHVAYLPLGLGLQSVVEVILRQTLQACPDGHILLVVDRPAQALGAAARLRKALDAKVAVFCGGDFLYSFESDFASARVLVFTAGLLLRLVKMGTYTLGRASLLVLLDAFAVIRNHPMNTLIREYYWKMETSGDKPRLLGVLSPQLHSKPRPFDKIRQHVRKLQHSMQATLLLPGTATTVAGQAANSNGKNGQAAAQHGRSAVPAKQGENGKEAQQAVVGDVSSPSQQQSKTADCGCGLKAIAYASGDSAAGTACGSLLEVEGGLHQHPIMLHAYTPWREERQLTTVLQQHCLSLWDVLHEFNLNHFGRLLHFVAPGAATAPDTADGSTQPSFPLCRPAIGSPQQQQALSRLSDCGAQPPPLAQFSSNAMSASVAGDAAGAAAGGSPYSSDPMHHDWLLVETMLRQSIWHTDLLPSNGEHGRDAEALALMMHVLECVQALRACFEIGKAQCLRLLLPSLRSLYQLLSEGPPAIPPSPLRARIAEVAAQSKLLAWAKDLQAYTGDSPERPLAAGESALEGENPSGGAVPNASIIGAGHDGINNTALPNWETLPATSLSDGGRAGAMPTRPAADTAVGEITSGAGVGSRGAMLLQLLLEILEDVQQTEQSYQAQQPSAKGGANPLQVLAEGLPLEEEEETEGLCAENPHHESHVCCLDEPASFSLAASTAAADASSEQPDGTGAQKRSFTIAVITASADSAAALQHAMADALPGVSTLLVSGSSPDSSQQNECVEEEVVAGESSESPELVRVVLLTKEELGSLPGATLLSSCNTVVWFSSDDVFHAASHDCDSAAFTACHMLCYARSGSSDGLPLECHVLATAEQVAAYQEAQKADQTLKAALQLVQLGDAAFEDSLVALSQPEGSEVLEGQAASILEVVCLGLCGEPPSYNLTLADRASPTIDDTSATFTPAAETAELGFTASQQTEHAASPESPPATLLFRASVSLPHAYFPAQKFHPQPAMMPTRPIKGRAKRCQAEACNTAAFRALCALHDLGILSRYWPTRLLLAQSLLPKGASTIDGNGTPGELSHFLPGAVPLSQSAGYICPLCNVAATGHRAFVAHLRGFRHQRRVKQQRLLGRELPEWLTAMSAQLQQLEHGRGGLGGEELEDGNDGDGELPPDAEMYSPVPTQYYCSTCNVYCTSAWLLEAHERGHKHQRRAAGVCSPTKAVSRGHQPLVTPYYCSLCGMYATSEDQLRMHCLGKRHSRNLALQQGRGGGRVGMAPTPFTSGRAGPNSGVSSAARWSGGHPAIMGGGGSEQYVVAAAAAAAAAAGYGGIAVTPGGAVSHFGSPRSAALGLSMRPGAWPLQGLVQPPPLPYGLPFGAAHAQSLTAPMGLQGRSPLGGNGGGITTGTPVLNPFAIARDHSQQLLQQQGVGVAVSPAPPPPPPTSVAQVANMPMLTSPQLPQPSFGGSPFVTSGGQLVPEGVAALLTEGSVGTQRVYRCDLCGVVTPSKSHYDYHLQGAKHLRRQARQLGGMIASAPASVAGSGPGTPIHPSSPAAGGTPVASLAGSRGVSPLRGSLLGEGAQQDGAVGPVDGQGGVDGSPVVPSGSLICSVCGIMATSQLNLEDHYKGRRHQKNVERLQRHVIMPPPASLTPPQARALLLAASGSSGLESQPSDLGHLRAAVESVLLSPASSMPRLPSGTNLGSGGSIKRVPSDNLYDNFPCVRIGDVNLPSSMDLRAYLDELQHLEGWDPSQEALPAIAEHAADGQHFSSATGSPESAERAAGGGATVTAGGGSEADLADAAAAAAVGTQLGKRAGTGVYAGSGGASAATRVLGGELQHAAGTTSQALSSAAGDVFKQGGEALPQRAPIFAQGPASQRGVGSRSGNLAAAAPSGQHRLSPLAPTTSPHSLCGNSPSSSQAATLAANTVAVPNSAMAPLQEDYSTGGGQITSQGQRAQQSCLIPPTGGVGGARGGGHTTGTSTPTGISPQWRGGNEVMEGVVAGGHIGFVPGPSVGSPSVAQIPPGQAAFGVVPFAHMMPMMHPMQMQYSMQYSPPGMAVPMPPLQYGSGVAQLHQSHLLPQQGWVQMQPAYRQEEQMAFHMHQQQRDATLGRRGR